MPVIYLPHHARRCIHKLSVFFFALVRVVNPTKHNGISLARSVFSSPCSFTLAWTCRLGMISRCYDVPTSYSLPAERTFPYREHESAGVSGAEY